MIEILGLQLTYEAVAFLVLFLFDEALPHLPVKGNNLLQFVSGVVGALKPHRKEDEVLKAIKEELSSLHNEIEEVKLTRRTTPRTPRTPRNTSND